MSTNDKTQLRVGRLTKAHGLKGALKLELFTDTPEQRFTPGSSFTLQVPETSEWHGRSITLTELRWYNGHPVGFFEGVDDRTAAESLVKAILWVDQDLDELPDEDDAWYHHQLVGLRVERDGVEVGTVSRVDHLPAQDLLAVATPAGEVLVPFVTAIVPSVDIEAGVITVTPPAGLFEELVDDSSDDESAASVDTGDVEGESPDDAVGEAPEADRADDGS
ncbi:ribosome maturation factor RimM [Frigoribacterium sp. CFBP 8754]|uniref:ribosome maturation factor RimM n=1 Tax=unclassified Frigoribacterium TaxID=2627005 RepID=UPI0009EA826F|nr:MULTISPECIES: ribosome maturation factor RimM [unclassified Frigoribacterium]MBD8659096.1 ribosome maturation factor RimM [Frigoribacterium sp. CFBP 8754]QNE44892.1 ribosome maturation factor RimM [Frigoribacterium sp. NBH87]